MSVPKDKPFGKGCGIIIGFVIAVLLVAILADLTGLTSGTCNYYSLMNKYIGQLGFWRPPQRSLVGSNVSYISCSSSEQALIKADMLRAYDNLVGGCFDTDPSISNMIVDFLTCEPLEIACDPAKCAERASSCGFVESEEFYAGKHRFNRCFANDECNLSNYTYAATMAHELTHLVELVTKGWTNELLAPKVGDACS